MTILDNLDLSKPPEQTLDWVGMIAKGNKPNRRPPSKWARRWQMVFWSSTILFFAYQYLTTPLDKLSPELKTLGVLLIVVVVAASPLVLIGIIIIAPFYWVKQPIGRANYDKALKRAAWLERLPYYRRHIGSFLLGTVYSFRGDWMDAEYWLRENLERIGDEKPSSNAWENLGLVLLAQQRYTEAVQCFERSIQYDASNGGAYSSLAEVYLYQRINPQRALQLVDRALEIKLRPHSTPVDTYQISEMYAIRAWALQQLGRVAEADEAIFCALHEGDPTFKPTLAGIHHRAGLVMLERGNRTTARQHFEWALEADSVGAHGQRAQAALRRLG